MTTNQTMIIKSDIIIIGAGACGLMAARELSQKGKKVTVLEARNRTGGRIHTINGDGFLQAVETGPEFIHGNLPVTFKLLKKAGITYIETEGDMMRNKSGEWHEEEEQIEGWNVLMKKMNKLKEDTTLSQFLNQHFSEEKHSALHGQALQYAQGFDAVDPDKASVFALRNEWQNEEEVTYHIAGGYVRMVDALVSSCLENDCLILLNKTVREISWQKGEVTVTTTAGEAFSAKQIIMTVPLGVLQENDEKSSILFSPALPQLQEAVNNIGYGNVIKILLQFSHLFWQKQKEALFFFSDQIVTTWWTQKPSPYPMLTGWIAGKRTASFDEMSDEEMLQVSLQSIAGIFGKSLDEIKQILTASHIVNWRKDVYAKGAYSYSMTGSEEAKKILREPIADTIYFAGEGLYSGASGGTVEAALVQGLEVAKKVLRK